MGEKESGGGVQELPGSNSGQASLDISSIHGKAPALCSRSGHVRGKLTEKGHLEATNSAPQILLRTGTVRREASGRGSSQSAFECRSASPEMSLDVTGRPFVPGAD